MDTTRSRRMGALIASAALLASLTVATVAAPASAGKCEPYDKATVEAATDGCFYATEPITDDPTVPTGVVLNGSSGDDRVLTVDPGATFNGGRGDDRSEGSVNGTFNGGPGDDVTRVLGGTFNGGSGDDRVWAGVLGTGTFNGGGGDDCTNRLAVGATFAGGGGTDWYTILVGGSGAEHFIYSAELDAQRRCYINLPG